jgi:anaerobic dimethyl sulfoxide reductase subunit A
MKRRSFLKRNALFTGGALVGGTFISELMADEEVLAAAQTLSAAEKMIRVGCPSHNCGGRCLLKVYVKEGIIVRIETDDRPNDSIEDPQLRACLRGRGYRHRQYHSDRLKYPQIRVGKRGEGKFQRISWDEATDLMAEKILQTKEKYGNESIYIPYGTGSYNQINGKSTANRLMNLMGGSLGYYNSYSWACISKATPYVYGTSVTGNQRQDWVNAKYILMWGWNPSEMRDGTNSEYFIKKAKERGAKSGVHRSTDDPERSGTGR